MEVSLRRVIKGIAYSIATFLALIIPPYALPPFIRKVIPGFDLTSNLLITAQLLVVINFFLGFFSVRTIVHTISGMASCFALALYLFLMTEEIVSSP